MCARRDGTESCGGPWHHVGWDLPSALLRAAHSHRGTLFIVCFRKIHHGPRICHQPSGGTSLGLSFPHLQDEICIPNAERNKWNTTLPMWHIAWGILVSNSCGHGDPKITTWPACTRVYCAPGPRVKRQAGSQAQVKRKKLSCFFVYFKIS